MTSASAGLGIIARSRSLRFIINGITFWSFLFSIITTDYILAATTSAEPSNATSGVSGVSIEPKNLSVPLGSGEIKNTFIGSSGRTIIHIQDAHCNYAAQKSIEAIIKHLANTYDIKLVALEGGKGNYDLSIFTKIKDPIIRRKVSDYFVKEGRINGSEFFAINNPDKVKLFGIEDEELYKENLDAYRNSLLNKEEAGKYLNTLSTAIANLKIKIYSPELKALDEKVRAYHDNKIDFKKYIKDLDDMAEAAKIDFNNYKNMLSLIAILRDEKAINFTEADRERNKLIDIISRNISKANLEELIGKSARFKMGGITSEEFYSYLFKKARFSGVDFGTFPNLVKYSEYVNRYEAVDKAAIFIEIKGLERALINKSAKTEDQKAICSVDNDLTIIKGMFNISLMKEEFDYYIANRDSFRMKRFIDFVNTKAPLYGFSFKLNSGIEKMDIYIEDMEKFYNCSLKRDSAFIKNIEKKFKNENVDVMILVTGGFHADNLSRQFKEKGYSYIEVIPKFDKTDVPNPYFRLLSGTRSATDSILSDAINNKPGISNIAVETLFSQMGVSQEDAGMVELKLQLLTKLYSNPDSDFVVRTDWGSVVFSAKKRGAGVPGIDVEVNGIKLSASFLTEASNKTPDFSMTNRATTESTLTTPASGLPSTTAPKILISNGQSRLEFSNGDKRGFTLIDFHATDSGARKVTYRVFYSELDEAGYGTILPVGNLYLTLNENNTLARWELKYEDKFEKFEDWKYRNGSRYDSVENIERKDISLREYLNSMTDRPWIITARSIARSVTPRVTTNALGQIVVEVPNLKPVSKGDDNDWLGWMGIMADADREILNKMAKQDRPGMVNIPISEKMADAVFAQYHRYAMEVKEEASRAILQRFRIGDITLNLYRDDEKGRDELNKRIDEFGQESKRVITFAYKDETGKRNAGLEGKSYTVYMTGEEGCTLTPIGTCSITALAILNYYDLKDRPGADMGEAITLIAKGIAALSGTYNFEEIAKKIVDNAQELLASGLLLIRIRPVNTQEISEFHEREAAVLRSL